VCSTASLSSSLLHSVPFDRISHVESRRPFFFNDSMDVEEATALCPRQWCSKGLSVIDVLVEATCSSPSLEVQQRMNLALRAAMLQAIAELFVENFRNRLSSLISCGHLQTLFVEVRKYDLLELGRELQLRASRGVAPARIAVAAKWRTRASFHHNCRTPDAIASARAATRKAFPSSSSSSAENASSRNPRWPSS
jgi:hypothetical protein